MPFREWLTDVLTTPSAPRCDPEQHTAPGLCSEQGTKGFSSPGSSQLSCWDAVPTLPLPAAWPGAAWPGRRCGRIPGALALLLKPAWVSCLRGVPQEACFLAVITSLPRLTHPSALLLSASCSASSTSPPWPFTPHPGRLLLFIPWAPPTIPPPSAILAPGITDLLAQNVLGPGCSGSKMRWLT